MVIRKPYIMEDGRNYLRAGGCGFIKPIVLLRHPSNLNSVH